MRRLFDRGHLFERRMRQRIVLTAFDFHYIRTKALIEGGGGRWSLSTFLSQCGAFFGVVLNQGRDLLEYV